MSSKSVKLGLALLLVVAAAIAIMAASRDRHFVGLALPVSNVDRLFDVGVADIDGDGVLDLYTSNHHFRQLLALGDGRGGFRDVLSPWGLDQSRDFPLAELSFTVPEPDKPGVYLYWRGTQFVVQTHRSAELGAWRATLQAFDSFVPVKIIGDGGFDARTGAVRADVPGASLVEFSARADGKLVVVPGGQGLPLVFQFDGALRSDQIFVGLGKVTPRSTHFSLAMRDRHGHAWNDLNGDGTMDVFITRGALGGSLRSLPPEIAQGVRDELLVSRGPGVFEDETLASGITKKGCSGRHAGWVDLDRDGILELFVNCYDRGNVAGDYPKQVYRRTGPATFADEAARFGLAMPDQQLGSYAWVDVDGDRDIDMLAYQDEGVVLFTRTGAAFDRSVVATMVAPVGEHIGGTTESDWLFDGKILLADFNRDGQPDAFVPSKRGNLLLVGRDGGLARVDLTAVGLPPWSLAGHWVDFDNDGRLDLHLVPQGVYRQREDGGFDATGVLTLPDHQYQAAVVNWADFDNDGRVDVILALNEAPDFKRWWEFRKSSSRSSQWGLEGLRRVGPTGHWLQVDLAGQPGNPHGIGAKVVVRTGDSRQTHIVGVSEGSFFSQGHYRAYFGLGPADMVDEVRVMWPEGTERVIRNVAADQRLVLRQE